METMKKFHPSESINREDDNHQTQKEFAVLARRKENDRPSKNAPPVSFFANIFASSLVNYSLNCTEEEEVSIEKKVMENREDRQSSDEQLKISPRKEQDMGWLVDGRTSGNDKKCMETLQKLPIGSVAIKHEGKYKDDSDYVRDSTETSSGGSSSTSVCGSGRMKRIHRAMGKNRGASEIRRNPIRLTKKTIDKGFPRPRQRLLSAKRKEILLDMELNKRPKSSTMPYMNTRSVTRKLYNVGATYQAPTIKDETEWKEWPAHGMHERPVFLPQIGLAVEYLGKYYTSQDGFSYREIIDRPEIEVVSVDPDSEYFPPTSEKKRNKNSKSNRNTLNVKNSKTTESTEKKQSFANCMHESLHFVLGYCSQIMTPAYKMNVESKLDTLNRDKNLPLNDICKQNANFEMKNRKNDGWCKKDETFKENTQKSIDKSKSLGNCTIKTQNILNIGQNSKPRLFPAQKMFVGGQQKSIAITNLKTLQGDQIKLQDVRIKNPVIIVNPSETKTLKARILKPTSSDGNTIKFEEAVGDESLIEMSSIYKNLISTNEIENARGISMKPTSMKPEGKIQFSKESEELPAKGKYQNVNTSCSKIWGANNTSEIARILSDYNKSTLKKPAIEKVSSTTIKSFRQKDFNDEKNPNQGFSGKTETTIQLPEGKWRRFHLTVEKLKDLKENDKILATRLEIKRPSITGEEVLSNASVAVRKDDKSLKFPEKIGMNRVQEKENRSVNIVGSKKRSLRELLENTSTLYCAATGVHQDDLANYIDSLDAKESLDWLESYNNSVS